MKILHYKRGIHPEFEPTRSKNRTLKMAEEVLLWRSRSHWLDCAIAQAWLARLFHKAHSLRPRLHLLIHMMQGNCTVITILIRTRVWWVPSLNNLWIKTQPHRMVISSRLVKLTRCEIHGPDESLGLISGRRLASLHPRSPDEHRWWPQRRICFSFPQKTRYSA